MRQIVVAANWKMNKTLQEGISFVEELSNNLSGGKSKIIINVPYVMLSELSALTNGSGIHIGAQNVHELEAGAYTGEVSASMIKSCGATHVVVGHSERRMYFGEDDPLILKKIKAVLSHGLVPIYCCGEPLEIRDKGLHESYVKEQMENSILQLSESQIKHMIIAYEPVWAIGTGRTASEEQAQEMHRFIRSLLSGKWGQTIAQQTPILYGGSCNTKNAASLFSLAVAQQRR